MTGRGKKAGLSKSSNEISSNFNTFLVDEQKFYPQGSVYGSDQDIYLPINQFRSLLSPEVATDGRPPEHHGSVYGRMPFNVNDYPEFYEVEESKPPYVSTYHASSEGSYDINAISGFPLEGSNDIPQRPESTETERCKRTRSGLVNRSRTPLDVEPKASSPKNSEPKPAKTIRKKTAQIKIPTLEIPLSELTSQMAIPTRDMDAWVNRNIEERQGEPLNKNGNIARPMNSFMLYRSAFAERIKKLFDITNHQEVSAVAGASWRIEPVEVKDEYNEFARIERDKHARAHPSYKFSPGKGPHTKRKADGLLKDWDTERSDEDDDGDDDSEYRPRKQARHNEVASNDSTRFQAEQDLPVTKDSWMLSERDFDCDCGISYIWGLPPFERSYPEDLRTFSWISPTWEQVHFPEANVPTPPCSDLDRFAGHDAVISKEQTSSLESEFIDPAILRSDHDPALVPYKDVVSNMESEFWATLGSGE